MDSNHSKILFPINSIFIRDALEVTQSFTQNLEYFIEENVIELYIHVAVEEKQAFLSKRIKPKISIENVPFPLDIDLFNEESPWVLSLLG